MYEYISGRSKAGKLSRGSGLELERWGYGTDSRENKTKMEEPQSRSKPRKRKPRKRDKTEKMEQQAACADYAGSIAAFYCLDSDAEMRLFEYRGRVIAGPVREPIIESSAVPQHRVAYAGSPCP